MGAKPDPSISNAPVLCEDIVRQVLSRLPFKSLHKLKWVSKQWRSLITNEILPTFFSNTVVGLFRRVYGWAPVSKNSSSSPQQITQSDDSDDDDDDSDDNDDSYNKLTVIPWSDMPSAHCNGLFLDRWACTITNPSRKKHVSFPQPPGSGFYGLAFDPRVSPHYIIVYLRTKNLSSDDWTECLRSPQLMVYSSESRAWRTESASIGDVRLTSGKFNSNRRAAYCNGALYFVFEPHYGEGKDPGILRVGLTATGRVDGVTKFEIPVGFKKDFQYLPVGFSDNLPIGRMGVKLCCAEVWHNELRVWALEGGGRGGNDTTEWVMMHQSTFCKNERVTQDTRYVQFLAFHPFLDAIYIQLKGTIFLYDLGSMELDMIQKLDSEDTAVNRVEAIPFPFCGLDVLQY